MTPRVTSQIVAHQLSSQIRRHSANLHAYNKAVASGISISKPSDDISKFHMSLYHRINYSRLSASIEHISFSSNLLNAIVNALTNANNLLTKAHLIASSGIDATLDQSTLASMGEEVDMLLHNVLDIFNTDIYGSYLFSGDSLTIRPFSIASYNTNGRINSIVYTGSTNNSTGIITHTQTIPLYLAGGTIEQSGGNSIFQALIDLRDALLTNSPQRTNAITNAMHSIEVARDRISEYTGIVSSRLSVLRDLQERFDALRLEHKSIQSNLESTDYAEAIVKLNESQYLLQASMAITARYYSYSFLDYIA